MFFCSYVFKKILVLLFPCLQKNTCSSVPMSSKKYMFSCSYVFKKIHVLPFSCLQKNTCSSVLSPRFLPNLL